MRNTCRSLSFTVRVFALLTHCHHAGVMMRYIVFFSLLVKMHEIESVDKSILFFYADNEDICEKCYQFAKCYYDRSKVKVR